MLVHNDAKMVKDSFSLSLVGHCVESPLIILYIAVVHTDHTVYSSGILYIAVVLKVVVRELLVVRGVLSGGP